MTAQHSGTDPRLWVHVAHLPKIATEDWLRGLFVPIGTAMDVHLDRSNDAISAQVRFPTVEQAAAALQYDGFRTLGQMIRVHAQAADDVSHSSSLQKYMAQDTMPSPVRQRMPRSRRESDPSKTFRNLYVGNLPLNVNTDQMAALFAQYGSVTHCVILSTLDTQARRRGFIVMASPDESRLAIKGLNGFVWYGYPIEVSFALVQRSGGPLDPANESTVSRNVPRSRYNAGPRKSPDGDVLSGMDSFSSGDDANSRLASMNSAAVQKRGSEEVEDPNSIVVSGLDPVAIIDNDDLLRHMLPYGAVAAATLCRDDRGASRGFGIVTFEKEQDATRACAQLNQREIHGRRLRAQRYMYTNAGQNVMPNASLDMPWRSTLTPGSLGTPSIPATPLTPFASGADRSTASSMHAPPMAFSPFAMPTIGASTLANNTLRSSFDPLLPSDRGSLDLAGLLNSMNIGGSTSSAGYVSSSHAQQSTSVRGGSNSAAASSLETTPSFFQQSRKSSHISIRPDPLDIPGSTKPSDLANAPELGAAFEQRPQSLRNKDNSESGTNRDQSALGNDSSISTHAGVSLSPWSTNSARTSNAAHERFSPQSTLYTPSPSSSAGLQRTPDQGKEKELGLPFLPGATLASLSKASDLEESRASSHSREKAQNGGAGGEGSMTSAK